MQKEIDVLRSYFSSKESYNIAILTHHNADPDAFSSCVALKFFLSSFLPNSSIEIYVDSISELSRRFWSALCSDVTLSFSPPPSSPDAVFLCDVNNPLQLGKMNVDVFFSDKVSIFVIDHHSLHPFLEKATFSIVDPSASSTAELVLRFLSPSSFSFPANIASLLLSGIVFDTRKFTYLSLNTLEAVKSLFNMGADYSYVLSLFQQPLDRSERIARLKGAMRSILYMDEELIFVVSHSSSFESSVARALIDLGADLAAVIARPSRSELRVSLRCTRSFSLNFGINLGELSQDLAARFNGTGGGHQTAAGMNFSDLSKFPNDKGKLMKFFQKIILEYLKK